MRFSLAKGAHVIVSGSACRKLGVKPSVGLSGVVRYSHSMVPGGLDVMS